MAYFMKNGISHIILSDAITLLFLSAFMKVYILHNRLSDIPSCAACNAGFLPVLCSVRCNKELMNRELEKVYFQLSPDISTFTV